MTITHRVLNTKRHTAGYVISRKEVARTEAVKLARLGKIKGVRIASGRSGSYLVSTTGSSLYSLPTKLSGTANARIAAKTRKNKKTSR